MNSIAEAKISDKGEIILDEKLSSEVRGWGKNLKAYIDGKSLILVPIDEILDPKYPGIVSYKNICDGEPIIRSTRVTVRNIVEYFRLYGKINKIIAALPHLNENQVTEAMNFYYDHQDEIDKYIAENDEEYQEKLYQEWKNQ